MTRWEEKPGEVPRLRCLRGGAEKEKMPGFPTQIAGTPTNRGKARRYTVKKICLLTFPALTGWAKLWRTSGA
jgi:hypothetical protein